MAEVVATVLKGGGRDGEQNVNRSRRSVIVTSVMIVESV